MKPDYEAYLNRVYGSNWVSSLLGGFLLAMSFSPYNIAILSIPGFMLLLRVADRSLSIPQVMYLTFPGFLVWNAVTTYWLVYATLPGGIAAITANAILMTIPMAIIHKVRRAGFGQVGMAISVASIWVSYEFFHLQWDLAWPWLIIGNAYANWIPIVQYVELTGVMGVSFWSVFAAALLLYPRYLTTEPTPEQLVARAMGRMQFKDGEFVTLTEEIPFLKRFKWSYAVLILALPLASLIWYYYYNPEPTGFTEVVVVQPNFDSYLDAGGYADATEALESIIGLTDDIVTDSTAAIFWPENALRSPVFDTRIQFPTSRLLLEARDWNAPVITGASWYKYYEEDELPRVYRTSAGGLLFNVYNAAVGFYPDGSMNQYRKAKLVPIVERFPFINILALWKNPWFDWPNLSGYGRGYDVVNFDVGGLLSPALVCYDSVFPDWVRLHVLEGADYITIITNDGWWGDTSGHVQHFDFARLRAVETRRTVLRSANNGISGMIGPRGEVLAKTDYWVRTALNLEVATYDRITFYTQHGDWIGWFSASLTLLSLLWIPVHRKSRNFIVD
ncbi:MAG: apolipoprotein N-acyltransferase [Balneolales bacterium]|nr:apolipoprotein N-acyltransferase [Balneolales bacterium]